jgi:hypothetical protein
MVGVVDVNLFVEDDRGYELWLIRNRRGWVLNAYREPTPGYLVLHSAACSTVSGRPAKGQHWTADYAKICCSDRSVLENWALENVGASPQRCTHCMTPA